MARSFQDIEASRRLTSDFASTMQRGRYYEQRGGYYDQRQRQYEQKQAIDEQERRKERAGARLTGILSSGIPTEQMYKQIQALQEEFKNTDLAGTSAGRGMFGAYGMFGRRAGGTGNVPEGVDLSKLHKDRNAAMNAGNTAGVAYYDKLLARENERIADQRVIAEDRRDPLDVSLEAAKGIRRPRTVVDPNLLAPMADMTDVDAVTGAARKATMQGQKIIEEGQFSDPQLQAIWERAKKQGITIEQFRAELNK